MDQKRLISLAKQGNKEAIEALYKECFTSLYKFVYFKVDYKETAEDICAEAFTRAFINIGKFKENCSFKTWMYTIAKNLVIDWYKNKGKVIPINENLATQEIYNNPEQKIQNLKQIKEILDKLKPSYRQVLELRFLSNMSIKETAEAMKISENNVKVLQNRALKKAGEIKLLNEF